MPGLCCVPRCNGRGGHRFPSDTQLYLRWLTAVKRGEQSWKPSKWTLVCKAHFTEEDYITKTRESDGVSIKILKKDVVPHIFDWTRVSRTAQARAHRSSKRQKQEDMRIAEGEAAWAQLGSEVEVVTDTPAQPDNDVTMHSESSGENRCTPTTSTCTQTNSSGGISPADFMFDKAGFHYYTGMECFDHFQFLFSTFGETVNELNYYYGSNPSMPAIDQFFMTLIKLRLARNSYELSLMFRCSEKDVSNIFITWVNFLYYHFKDINWWPSRDLVRFFSPSDFRAKYPTTRVIIDGTECPLAKPKQPVAQQGTYSTYKNRNTVKALIGITPGGLVSYVSDIYGGAASDRQICERSPLLKLCESGDSIMADKGFNVQDLFVPCNVAVNIPEFFKKKNRMSANSVLSDRKIASKRVHVERMIGLAKTFKILTKPLNNTESGLADAIITVCFCLCNFRPAIVPRDA